MSYRAIETIFELIDEPVTASEAHGIATGMLCVDHRADSAIWIEESTQGSPALLSEDRTLLISLFEQTRQLIEKGDFDFDLFLPDEDQSLNERADALKNWCQGFLYGIGFSGPSSEWPGEADVILKDIAEISRLDNDAEGEEDEFALMEIHEYLRTVVLLIADELAGRSGNESIH